MLNQLSGAVGSKAKLCHATHKSFSTVCDLRNGDAFLFQNVRRTGRITVPGCINCLCRIRHLRAKNTEKAAGAPETPSPAPGGVPLALPFVTVSDLL